MSVIQVGLVDKTGELDTSLVQAAAAALNIQVMRDLPQYWNIQATVRYLPDAKKIPSGVWPVFLVPKLPPGEGGVHLDKHNQPYSLVIGTPGSADWTIDASHETIEMLVDPAGNRLQTSQAIEISGRNVVDTIGQFEYLVEACDPCEADQYAYPIQGIAVSDFITPHFYDPVETQGTRYSFGGNITRPREVLPGGYISYINTQTDEWQQILFLSATPQYNDLGPAEGASLRVFVDNATQKFKSKMKKKLNPKLSKFCKESRGLIESAAAKKAQRYAEY